MAIEIERWAGREASVNSWLIHDETSTVVVDVLRNSSEAEELADHLDAGGRRVAAVLVTHGHPDHFIGLGVMNRRFPEAPLLVATEAVRESIVGFATWMTAVGWLDAEAHMQPLGSSTPNGFDYGSKLGVVEGGAVALDGGDVITLCTDHPATECDVMTTLSVPAANAFFPADLLYVGVHSWQGPDVTRTKVEAWIATLEQLRVELPADTIVCPGHGPATDRTAFGSMAAYLRDFLDSTSPPTTRQAAVAAMTEKYPSHEQADFLLAMSVDFHVPEA